LTSGFTISAANQIVDVFPWLCELTLVRVGGFVIQIEERATQTGIMSDLNGSIKATRVTLWYGLDVEFCSTLKIKLHYYRLIF